MSTKVISSIAVLLATFLPLMGVEIGTEALTSTIQNVVYIISGIYVWYRTVQKENLTPLGVRK